MGLRAKKPTKQDSHGRLKALFFGTAGVGKTTAAIQMPRPYVIDCERGTDHYGEVIARQDGAVLHASTMAEVIDEVRLLATTEHDYLTLVIDPFTLLYDQALEEGEAKVGAGFNKHFGYANTLAKRLYKLLVAVDMNVIAICHAKAQYDKKSNRIADTFDGWKRLDYLFDLVFEIQRHAKAGDKRVAVVRKTRIDVFPDGAQFVWSFDELERRLGKDVLDRRCAAIETASEDEVTRFVGLYHRLTPEDIERLRINKVVESADEVADLSRDRVLRGIEVMGRHLNPDTAH